MIEEQHEQNEGNSKNPKSDRSGDFEKKKSRFFIRISAVSK
ncbi:MAG: hypothetical protein ACI4P6_02675 [Candidatus Spyradosoma sp.]